AVFHVGCIAGLALLPVIDQGDADVYLMLDDFGNGLTHGCVKDIGCHSVPPLLGQHQTKKNRGARQATCVGAEHTVGTVLHRIFPRSNGCSVCGSIRWSTTVPHTYLSVH